MENISKNRLNSFLIQCKRVWLILRKPSMDEFKGVAKIAALGLVVVGALGFIISDGMKFISNLF